MGHYWQLFHVDAKNLSRFFDAAKRIVKAANLPTKITFQDKKVRLHEVLGLKLSEAYRQGRLRISDATFGGNPQGIVEVIREIISEINPQTNVENINVDNLSAKRLIIETLSQAPKWQKILARHYDTTSPLQRFRALGALLEIEKTQMKEEAKFEDVVKERNDVRLLHTRLTEGQLEVMKRMMHSSDLAAIYNDIAVHVRLGMEMGQNCESLIFRVAGPNGETNVPLLYTIADKQSPLTKSIPLKRLKAESFKETHKRGDLYLPDSMTPVRRDHDGNKYWTIKEYEHILHWTEEGKDGERVIVPKNPRRDFVVVIEKDGTKRLYKKHLRDGNDLLERCSSLKLKKLFADKPNAFIELEETTFDHPELNEGDIIPTVLRGTKLLATAHAGERAVETESKVESARALQIEILQATAKPISIDAFSAFTNKQDTIWAVLKKEGYINEDGKIQSKFFEFEKGKFVRVFAEKTPFTVDEKREIYEILELAAISTGVVVPLYTHYAEYCFGLVGEAFVIPSQLYIEDGDSMVASKKPLLNINEAMRIAAGGKIVVASGGKIAADRIPQTFFVGTGNSIEVSGYGISNVVETPAPFVTPENIDQQRIVTRFNNGINYTILAALAERSIYRGKRASALLKFAVPPFLLEPLQKGDLEALRGKFKNVSVGFMDLKSSTAMCEAFAQKGAAKDYQWLLSHLLTKIKEEVESLGINVALLKYIGDCVMFVTGVPYEGKNDHGHIIEAAIAMKKAIFKLNSDHEFQAFYKKHKDIFQGGSTAKFCTGIASGIVFAGDILAKGEIDYRKLLTGSWFEDQQMVMDVIGSAVNTSARLESAARAWEVRINNKTIKGALEEGSLQRIIKQRYNDYCMDIDSLRENFLIPYYDRRAEEGDPVEYTLAELNEKLEVYKAHFKEHPLTLADLTVKAIAQGKGTGIEPAVYFRWDVKPIVLKRLAAVGITVPEDNGETAPPSIAKILSREYSSQAPDRSTIERLVEYGKFVGFDHLRKKASLIKNREDRDRVLTNIETAEGFYQEEEMGLGV
jgi:class 3 adenylate cyclase